MDDTINYRLNEEAFKRNLIQSIDTAISATDTNDEYSVGIRNGLRWCKVLLDGKGPQFEKVITKNRTTEFIHEVPTGHWIEPRKHGNWIYDENATNDEINKAIKEEALDMIEYEWHEV